MKTFENFLIDKHADQYMGLDDEMPDDYDNWIQDIDMDDMLKYAEEYGNEMCQEIMKLKGIVTQMGEDCEACDYRWESKPKEKDNGVLANSA
jgi:hypothetical protein